MPYLSKEKTSEIRKELKIRFPEFKFSVRNRDASALYIAVMAGPIDFGSDYISVNHYNIEQYFEGNALKFLSVVKEIACSGVYEETYDGDYGSIPSYYVNISVGKWDNPYEVK